MLALLTASWASGWLLGGAETAVRKAMTLTTSLRNVGIGLVIATSAFPGTPAITAAVAYGLFTVIGSLLLALAWARRRGTITGTPAMTALQRSPAEPVSPGRSPDENR